MWHTIHSTCGLGQGLSDNAAQPLNGGYHVHSLQWEWDPRQLYSTPPKHPYMAVHWTPCRAKKVMGWNWLSALMAPFGGFPWWSFSAWISGLDMHYISPLCPYIPLGVEFWKYQSPLNKKGETKPQGFGTQYLIFSIFVRVSRRCKTPR